MSVVAVTDASFEREVLQSELPVLIDFHADWCQPCKQLTPIVHEVAQELEGKLKVVSIDIDRNPYIAQSFRVQSIPMLVVIHQGRLAAHHLGVLDKKALLKLLAPVLPAGVAEVQPQELAQMLAMGRALPVDLRDAGSFARYRIPGALHVPLDEVDARRAELTPLDARVRVLYARGGEEGKQCAESLLAKGVEVAYLAGGFLGWEAEGMEVERGG